MQAALALTGVGVSCRTLLDALQDHSWVQHSRLRPETRYLASARIRQEVGRLLLQGLLACAGIGACWLPRPSPSPYTVVMGTTLLIVTIALVVASVWDWWDRVALTRFPWDQTRRFGEG